MYGMETDCVAGEEPTSRQHPPILSADIVGDGSVKLFNKWSFEDVEVKDISLTYFLSVHSLTYSDYIQLRHAVYLPHTAGRYASKRFRKAQCPLNY